MSWLSVKEVTLDHGGRTHLIRSLKLERKLKSLREILYEAAFPPACCCPQCVPACCWSARQMADALGLQLCPTAPCTQCGWYRLCLERSQTEECDRVSPGADLSPAYATITVGSEAQGIAAFLKSGNWGRGTLQTRKPSRWSGTG